MEAKVAGPILRKSPAHTEKNVGVSQILFLLFELGKKDRNLRECFFFFFKRRGMKGYV